jgi:hypothetical protein
MSKDTTTPQSEIMELSYSRSTEIAAEDKVCKQPLANCFREKYDPPRRTSNIEPLQYTCNV